MLSVSTKTGDKGLSGLANGQRLPKNSFIFEVLGTQDELNSWLGVVIAHLSQDHQLYHTQLQKIQESLFYIGAELAKSPKTKFDPQHLTELEQWSETMQSQMKDGWTTLFLYPGGHPTAAFLDVARAVARRLERLVVTLSETQEFQPEITQYLNRLSDYLYVLRCWVNQEADVTETQFSTKNPR